MIDISYGGGRGYIKIKHLDCERDFFRPGYKTFGYNTKKSPSQVKCFILWHPRDDLSNDINMT